MTSETETAQAGRGVALDRNVEVFPDQPLPHLDSPHARAYLARDRRRAARPMYALLCSRELPPRQDLIRALARTETPALISPRAAAVIGWPLDEREHQVVVFDQPGGPRVVPSNGTAAAPFRDDHLMRNVIPALAGLLREFKGRMISHRAIRASNVFYADESRKSIVLGECVSEPAAYSQPLVYEPIETAMATPAGRGGGAPPDDIYAMGVLLIALLSGAEPCARMSDEEIVNNKMRLGSYATMVRDLRLSLSMMEPLRGMLSDSPLRRWTADDLTMWASGNRQTTKPHTAPRKMHRPFEFKGQEYWHTNTLSHAMSRNWSEAVESRPAAALSDWLEKGYGDSAVRNAVSDKIKSLLAPTKRGPDAQDRELASLLTMMDPSAPIRFRNLAVMPDALGQVLAMEFRDKTQVADFVAVMRARLPNIWLEMQPSGKPEFQPVKKAVELAQGLIQQEGWGYGLERCLYEMNPSWPCQSPLLERFLVTRIEHLLPALERIAAEGKAEGVPMDAHIAAFCAAHLNDLPKAVLTSLGEPEESATYRLAVLSILARAQAAGRVAEAPALGRWMFRCLSPVIEGYNSRPYRRKLAERLQGLGDDGRLGALLSAADNPGMQARDNQAFERAKAIYARAEREIVWLREGGLSRPEQVRRGSEQVALLASSVLSGMALIALTVAMVS